MTEKKRSFALGYSYVLESFLSWFFYGLLIASGLSTIIANFSGMTGIPTASLYSINTIGGYISVAGAFLCSVIMKKTSIRFLTTISYIITAVGIFIMGHGNSMGAFLVFSALSQFFYHGYCYGSSNALIANWFPRKRGFILGITTTGLMISTMTGVMFMTKMTPVLGWTTMCNIIAAVVGALGIVSWFWIKDRPEDVGLLPDNMPISEEEKAALSMPANEIWTVKELLTNKDSWMYILGMGCLNMVGTGTLVMCIPLMMELGFSNVTAVLISSLGGVFAIFGSLILGWVDTKMGTKKATVILSICYSAGPLLTLAFALAGIVPGALICYCLTLGSGGALANVGGSLVVNMYGRAGYNQAWRYLNTGAQLLKACCYAAIGIVTAMLGQYAFVCGVWGIVGLLGLIFICCGKFNLREHK